MERFDIKTMSNDELKFLSETVAAELESRRSARRDELIQTVCDAMNALSNEFPYTELNIPYHCVECGYEDDVDVMYALCSGRVMTPKDFGGM